MIQNSAHKLSILIEPEFVPELIGDSEQLTGSMMVKKVFDVVIQRRRLLGTSRNDGTQ